MRMRPCPCLLLLLLLGVILCPSAEARKDDSEGRVSSAARAAATAVKSAAAKVSGASRGVAAKVSDQAPDLFLESPFGKYFRVLSRKSDNNSDKILL